jgi:hypothetical protein
MGCQNVPGGIQKRMAPPLLGRPETFLATVARAYTETVVRSPGTGYTRFHRACVTEAALFEDSIFTGEKQTAGYG